MIVFDRQTETGSIVVTPFPGAIETKPGSATVPFLGHQTPSSWMPLAERLFFLFWMQFVIRIRTDECNIIRNMEGNNVARCSCAQTPLAIPCAYHLTGTHKRYLETYMKALSWLVLYRGRELARDEHGYIWIKGRLMVLYLCSTARHESLIALL